MIDAFLQAAGIKKAALIGGLFGALISLKFAGDLTPGGRAVMFLCGLGIASFLAPLAAHVFAIGEEFTGGVAFVLGLLGMAIMAAVIGVLPEVLKSRLSK